MLDLRIQLFFLLLLVLFQPLSLFAQEQGRFSDDEAAAMHSFIQGITDFENEDYERALDHLTEAHLKLPDDPGINYALADVYFAIGDVANAKIYAEIAADLDPENKWYQLKLADIYRQSGHHEAAVNTFETILEHHPGDPDVLYMLAQSYMEFGELEKSNEMLDRMLGLNGNHFEIHYRKFQNYHALQMPDSALVQLERMRELNPGNLTTLHTISQYYLELGDMDSARKVLLDARDRNSRDPQTLILLAELYVLENEWEKVGDTFVSMLEDPLIYPSQKLEFARFIYLQYQNNPGEQMLEEQTRSVLNAFSENEPEYAPAQLIAAEFFLQRNEWETALPKLERVNSAIPQEADAWRQRMQTLFALQRYDEVISISEDASEYAPNDAFILFFTGAAYMLTDRPEEAEALLENATAAPAQRSFRSVVHGTLGDVKQDLDHWEEAVEAYEMALRLDANNHNAMNNYAYFLSVREERLDYAQELAERAIRLDPDNAAYLDTVGWIYYKQGNYEQAKQYIRQSVDTGDVSAEVYEHLGDVYQALDEPQKAQKWWGKALESDPERDYLEERIESRE